MVQNLNHYEKILSRSHSNYLAQISIEMAKANNDTNDTLSRLTILGTILVPMNLVTGLWVSYQSLAKLTVGNERAGSWARRYSSHIEIFLFKYPAVHSSLIYTVLGGLFCFAFLSVIALRKSGLV
jgi:hypothetical protein